MSVINIPKTIKFNYVFFWKSDKIYKVSWNKRYKKISRKSKLLIYKNFPQKIVHIKTDNPLKNKAFFFNHKTIIIKEEKNISVVKIKSVKSKKPDNTFLEKEIEPPILFMSRLNTLVLA